MEQRVFHIFKFVFFLILLIFWTWFVKIQLDKHYIFGIILILLSINFINYLAVIFLSLRFSMIFIFLSVSISTIYNFYVILTYNNLLLYSIAMMLVGFLYLFAILFFRYKIGIETSMNKEALSKLYEEYNLFQNSYKDNQRKNTLLKTHLNRMKKISHAAFLMGGTTDEKEATDYLTINR